jgi:hypothetical protein
MATIAFVNAYAVTRHFGGREEGGWWFNAGSPLASVPVEIELAPAYGEEHRLHGCVDCFSIDHVTKVSLANLHKERERLTRLLADCAHGDINSVNGGVEVDVSFDWDQAEHWPTERPRYE